MGFRQSFMKTLYSFVMLKGKLFQSDKGVLENKKNTPPPVPFYSLHATANDGTAIDFQTFKGKKILLVNTASNCGYTGQYAELQTLYLQNRDKLIIIGFPANDFKEQEKGTDEEIASFCQRNFGVTFPLMKKSSVVKGSNQHEVFAWLSDSTKNGWNNQAPTWNFCKYLVNEDGVLTHYFDKGISPLDKRVTGAL